MVSTEASGGVAASLSGPFGSAGCCPFGVLSLCEALEEDMGRPSAIGCVRAPEHCSQLLAIAKVELPPHVEQKGNRGEEANEEKYPYKLREGMARWGVSVGIH